MRRQCPGIYEAMVWALLCSRLIQFISRISLQNIGTKTLHFFLFSWNAVLFFILLLGSGELQVYLTCLCCICPTFGYLQYIYMFGTINSCIWRLLLNVKW